jgi:hypothetical protein
MENPPVLICAECGCLADEEARGWRAYRDDVPGDEELPSVALFCPPCAATEFDAVVDQ